MYQTSDLVDPRHLDAISDVESNRHQHDDSTAHSSPPLPVSPSPSPSPSLAGLHPAVSSRLLSGESSESAATAATATATVTHAGLTTTLHHQHTPHATVHTHGVTVEANARSPMQYLRSFARSRQSHWLLVFLFFLYLVIIPMILVMQYYLDVAELLTAGIAAILLPLILYHFIWRHMVSLHPSLEPSGSSSREGSNTFFRVVSKHWTYEIYQLLLTLLSCATYLFYTYHLHYAVTSSHAGDYSLTLPSTSEFVQVEYFLIVSLSMDYLLRLMTVKHKFQHVFSFYSCIDLLCFTGVSYFSFFHTNLAPTDATYNYYLFQAPFRFLRMRRALKSLDAPIRSRTGVALYQLGPFAVTKKTAFLTLFGARVLLFIASAAAIILAIEFPCEAMSPRAACQPALHEFHLCLYFIICTLSTVGYGDLTAATDAGRMLVAIIIVYAAIQVPREIQIFADLEASEHKEEEEQAKMAHSDGIQSNQYEQVEMAMMIQPPGADADATMPADPNAGLLNVADGSGDFSSSRAISLHRRRPSAPAAATHRTPTMTHPHPHPQPNLTTIALQHFIDDDTPFLARWAEKQIRVHMARDAGALDRMIVAINGASVVNRASGTAEDKVSHLVCALFGSAGRSSSSPSPVFGSTHHEAAAYDVDPVRPPLPLTRDSATANLPSRDFDRTAAFYNKIGFTVTYRDQHAMRITRRDINIEFFTNTPIEPLSTHVRCSMRLADLNAFYGACKGAGIPESRTGYPRIQPPQRESGGETVAELIDTEGNRLRLIQNTSTDAGI